MSVSPSPSSPRVAGFLLAEAFSAVGTWATLIAIWAYAAYEFDATAGEVAQFGVAFSLPAIVLGPLTGTLIDRFGPKAILAVSKVIGVVASLALLAADDFRTLALLSAVHGVAGAFGVPALQSMPPRLVGDEHLARTNALVSLSDEFAIILGPVFAGVAIKLFGFRGAFVFDAVTFAVGLLVLPIVRLRAIDTPPHEDGGTFRKAFAGIALVARRPRLRRTVATVASVHLLYGVALLSEPLYVRDVLGESPDVFAALQTVFGISLVIAAVGVARAGERIAGFGWVVGGAIGSSVAAVVYLGTPFLAVAVVGVVVWGAVTAVISGPSRTVLQRATPEGLHGRVLATDFLASSSAELLGVVVAGALVSATSVPVAVTGLSGLVAGVAVVGWLGERRDTTPLDHAEPVPTPVAAA